MPMHIEPFEWYAFEPVARREGLAKLAVMAASLPPSAIKLKPKPMITAIVLQ